MGMVEQGRCRQGIGWLSERGLREHVAGLGRAPRMRERGLGQRRERMCLIWRMQTLTPFVISNELTAHVSCP